MVDYGVLALLSSNALKYSGIGLIAVALSLFFVFFQQCSDYSHSDPQWASLDTESRGVDWTAMSARGNGHVDLAQCHAEAAYRENVQRRKVAMNGRLQPGYLEIWEMKLYIISPLYSCPFEERIGAWGDGGKWTCMIPGIFQPDTIVYSIGSKGIFDFEQQFAKAHPASIFTFDPFLSSAVEAKMRSLPFLHYQAIGLTGEADLERTRKHTNKEFVSLAGLLSMMNHTYVDVFKIDCEGCELKVIQDMASAYGTVLAKLVIHGGVLPFGQILMEFHNLETPRKMLPAIYALENLGYRIFHAEFNPITAICVEISFIHESLVKPSDPGSCSG